MENLILRIDDRLIHGQVIVGWVQRLNLDNIIVANDELAANKLKINLYRVAIPEGVESVFVKVDETVGFISSHERYRLNTIIIVKNPQEVLKIVKDGFQIKSINVGGMHYQKGKRQLDPIFSIDKKDMDALFELHRMGIELEARALPFDEKIDVIKFMKESNISE